MRHEDTIKVTIGVSVPVELRSELVKLTRSRYRSLSAACRAFIEEGVKREKERSSIDGSDEQPTAQ